MRQNPPTCATFGRLSITFVLMDQPGKAPWYKVARPLATLRPHFFHLAFLKDG